jgi:hypothetical protein
MRHDRELRQDRLYNRYQKFGAVHDQARAGPADTVTASELSSVAGEPRDSEGADEQAPCGGWRDSHFLRDLPRGPAVLIELSKPVPIDDHLGATADAALLAGFSRPAMVYDGRELRGCRGMPPRQLA